MKILVADDETVNLELLDENLSREGYDVIKAKDGDEVIAALKRVPDIDLILLDRMMPNKSGIEVMLEMKAEAKWSDIPVIFQTAYADSKSIIEGIEAGAYYYLTKPFNKEMLISIVKAAIADSKSKRDILDELKKNRCTSGLLNNARFEYRTIDEARNLSYFIANSNPEPEKIVLGLTEILINAVEHGNLGITYKEKGDLVRESRWQEEIERRLKLPENANKIATVLFEKKESEILITVKDEGSGFEFDRYMELSPERATDPNGRGIIIAKNISFDDIQYRGCGNEVMCKVILKKTLN